MLKKKEEVEEEEKVVCFEVISEADYANNVQLDATWIVYIKDEHSLV